MAGDFDLTDWNGPEIVAALTEPFHRANEVLGRKFQKEITSPKWSWPTDPSPRDIVDHGDLRRSYVAERVQEASGPAHDHSWSQDYSMAVHEGAAFDDPDRPEMPARRWTEEPLKTGQLQKAFEKYAPDALGRVK